MSKQYSVRILRKSDEPEVEAELAKHPLWKRAHARDLVARRKFVIAIGEAQKRKPMNKENSTRIELDGRRKFAQAVTAGSVLSTLETTANNLITARVEDYRKASAGRTRASLKGHIALTCIMDRNAGALDALFELFPDLPAWRDTKWIH